MAYKRVKTIYGRQYQYIVEGKRINGKVKQHVIQYLGPVDPIYKQIKKRRIRSRIFVRKLTDSEIQNLLKNRYSSISYSRDRARIILYSAKGLSPLDIADKLNFDVRRVRNAIKEFNSKGLTSLKRGKPIGAVPKFTKTEIAKMLEIARTDPVKLNLHFTSWSLRKLKKYFEAEGIVDSISIASIQSIFKKQKVNWRKSKRFQYSNDPNFAKKNSSLMN